MQAVVLVGGKGSRLGRLTTKTPKPMLEVAGKPLIHFLCRHLELSGYSDIVLLAGFEGQVVSEYFGNTASFNANIKVVIEREPLGTAGALRNAEDYLQETFLLLNGDTWFDIPLRDFFTPQNLRHANTVMRMALGVYEVSERFGATSLAQGLVTGFGDIEQSSSRGLVNCGVYAIKRELIAHIPAGFVSLESEVIPALLAQKMVAGDVFNAQFIDIGVPKDFGRSQSLLPTLLRKQAVFLQLDAYSELLGHADMTWPQRIALIYEDLPRVASILGARVFVVRYVNEQPSLHILPMETPSERELEDLPELGPQTFAELRDYIMDGIFFGSDRDIYKWLEKHGLCKLMCPSLNATSFFTSNFTDSKVQ